MTIIVKHSFTGKESLETGLINVLIARMQQIGSVENHQEKEYDGETQNEAITEDSNEGVEV